MSPTRSTLLLGALALASAAAAQDRGKLLGIKAEGDPRASVVLISADRPLSFTTMKLADPPRVVVDFADTEIAFSRRELTVEDGTVRRVAAAPAGARTARVVVELNADAEFDVRTARNQVQLRIARPVPLVAAEKKPQLLPEEKAPPANAPAPAEPQQSAAARTPPPPAPAAQAAATPKPPAPEPTPPPAPPPPGQSAGPQTQTQTRTEPRPETQAPAEPPAKPEKTPPAKTSPAEAAKIASLPKVSLVGSAPSASPPAARPRSARANITGLGFRPVSAGEVIVRSDHPLAYAVTADDKRVLLHLPGARIPLANNRRPLDTRFFDGAVQRIVPLAVAGGTDLRIELREPAEYKLEQSGPVLTVTFSAPR
ncbi:MAG TPA: AMIN domain-containing protein [Myxococcales bacterium]